MMGSGNRASFRWLVLVVLICVGMAFLAGAYAGRWAERSKFAERLAAKWISVISRQAGDRVSSRSTWSPKNTHLTRLETMSIHLPVRAGWGGGLQRFGESAVFFGTQDGHFGVVDANGDSKMLSFSIDMNLEALYRHTIYQAKNLNKAWIRVTGLNLVQIAPGRFELLVGHHYFDAKHVCMQLRLSRAVLAERNGELALEEPFLPVFTAHPCITFYAEGYEWAFEGHFSGGRIARLNDNEVLFSTGDHGWVGLRGYPAVSQQDASTLGKVLLIDLRTHAVTIFAKGIRNPQGLTIDSLGRVWETEHGPRGGDELNLIQRGQNYGWPESTYGTDYGPKPWSLNPQQGRHAHGIAPQFSWSPGIGVSNLIEVTGDEFPLWKGDLLVTSLVGQTVHRLRLEGTRIVYDEPILFEGDRLRDIVQLRDGRLALLTDQGSLIFVRNGEKSADVPFLDARRQQARTVDMTEPERAAAVAGRFASDAEARVAVAPHTEGDQTSEGERVFMTNCAACHSLQPGVVVIGPSLSGAIGRTAGAASFTYSAGLAQRGGSWTARRMVEFSQDPSAMYPGTVMTAVRLSSADRDALERYLDLAARKVP